MISWKKSIIKSWRKQYHLVVIYVLFWFDLFMNCWLNHWKVTCNIAMIYIFELCCRNPHILYFFFFFYEQFICKFLSIYRSQEKLVQNTDQQFFVPLRSESEFKNDGLGCPTIISLYSAFNRHKINCFGSN